MHTYIHTSSAPTISIHTYVHIYMYTHTYIHTHTYLCKDISQAIRSRSYTFYICIYTYILIYSHIHTYTHTYIPLQGHSSTYIHTYIHTYDTYIHACMHTYIHTFARTLVKPSGPDPTISQSIAISSVILARFSAAMICRYIQIHVRYLSGRVYIHKIYIHVYIHTRVCSFHSLLRSRSVILARFSAAVICRYTHTHVCYLSVCVCICEYV